MSNENNEVFNGINGIDGVDTPEAEGNVPEVSVDNRTGLQKFADAQAEKKVARETKKANKKAAKAAKSDRKGLTTKEKIAIGAGGGLLVGGLFFKVLKGIISSAMRQNENEDYELVDDNNEDEQETPCFQVEEAEDETVEPEETETAQEET